MRTESSGVRGAAVDTNLPISLFILGISRSGKTTLECILSKVGGIKCGYEKPIIERSVRKTMQSSGLLTLESLLAMPSVLDEHFTENYKRNLRQRAAENLVVTNTHPRKIAAVGRMFQTVPNSRFIFIESNPSDTAIKIFMTHYKKHKRFFV